MFQSNFLEKEKQTKANVQHKETSLDGSVDCNQSGAGLECGHQGRTLSVDTRVWTLEHGKCTPEKDWSIDTGARLEHGRSS